MSKSYLEKRIIKAGMHLCEERVRVKGKPITAEDIRNLKVKTDSPVLQGVYFVLGAIFFVVGLWAQFTTGNMGVSVMLLLVGTIHVSIGVYGKPKKVSVIESKIDLMDLTAEIVGRFVKSADEKRGSG